MNDKRDRRVAPFTRVQRLAIASVLVSGTLILGAGVLAWSGLYNVSASTDHFPATTWILKLVRDQSVRFHSRDIEVPADLNRDGQIELGASHYRLACASCHGSPGARTPPTSANMLPRPPDLTAAADRYSTRGLAWIIRHGFKYTGMPAWPAIKRADEVWPLVAFIERLNSEGPEIYPALIDGPNPDVRFLEMPVTATCDMCHDAPGEDTGNPLVPSLNGQSEDYLVRALGEYRSGARQSGYMMPIAFALTDQEVAEVAARYADVQPLPQTSAAAAESDADHGAQIAREGIASQDVPPCLACHGATRDQNFPRLYGQSALFLSAQLRHWQDGGRDVSDYGQIMSIIANRLTEQDIEDVTRYFERASAPDTAGEAE